MVFLLPLLEQIKNHSEDTYTNICILTSMRVMEATIIILKDYEYVNAIGIQMINLMEQLINQYSTIQPYEQEVSYQKLIIFLKY